MIHSAANFCLRRLQKLDDHAGRSIGGSGGDEASSDESIPVISEEEESSSKTMGDTIGLWQCLRYISEFTATIGLPMEAETSWWRFGKIELYVPRSIFTIGLAWAWCAIFFFFICSSCCACGLRCGWLVYYDLKYRG
eukprot:s1805_g7.t1